MVERRIGVKGNNNDRLSVVTGDRVQWGRKEGCLPQFVGRGLGMVFLKVAILQKDEWEGKGDRGHIPGKGTKCEKTWHVLVQTPLVMGEELETQERWEDCPKVTQLISNRNRMCTRLPSSFTSPFLLYHSALGLQQEVRWLHVVETPADFENELHLGVGAGSVSGLSWAGAEPGTWQFPGLSSPTHPKEAMAPMPSLIINSRFTGLELKSTRSGEQPGSLGS